MFRSIPRLALGLSLLAILLARAAAQEEKPEEKPAEKPAEKPKLPFAEEQYRRFFRKPETTIDYWAAINYEIRVGRLDFAGELLTEMVNRKPSDEDLLTIEREQGMSSFLRLRTIRWSKDPKTNKETQAKVDELIEQVSAALKTQLQDEKRIAKFIRNLTASAEERVYAIGELRRSGPLAVPHLVEALRTTKDAEERAAILSVMPQLHRNSVPAIRAALYVDDPVVQLELMDVLMSRGDPLQLTQRAETNPVPYLWYLSASPKMSDAVRNKARRALAYFLDVKPDRLPSAKVALTREAERYYLHRVKFADPKEVTIWRWDDAQKRLVQENLSSTQAELYYGLLFAGQALQLDPTDRAAQVIFLSLALDKAYERGGLDQPLAQTAPILKEVLATVNPDLLTDALDRALKEGRRSVILGTVQALGDLGEVRAVRLRTDGVPPLLRALNFPDRRVQMAAADAILRIPATTPPVATGRIVEILRRALAQDPAPKILVVDSNMDRAAAVAGAVRKAGFETEVRHTGKEALRRLTEASDIAVMLLEHSVVDPMLPNLLAQQQGDINVGRLPVVVTIAPDAQGNVPPELEPRLRRIMEPYRNITLARATTDPDVLALLLLNQIADTMGRPLTEEAQKKPTEAVPAVTKRLTEERQNEAAEAMLWLRRMAVGELRDYDVRPARDAILRAMRSDELAPLAIEAASRLPGQLPQQELATVALNGNRDPKFRIAAAQAMIRHIQHFGLALTNEQVQALREAYQNIQDPKIKAGFALVIGSMKADPRVTGERLQGYKPAPAAAPTPPEKEKEKDEKDKDQ